MGLGLIELRLGLVRCVQVRDVYETWDLELRSDVRDSLCTRDMD